MESWEHIWEEFRSWSVEYEGSRQEIVGRILGLE